jgi:hypothetical protein
MKTYKRTTVNLVKSIIIAPFTMVLVYIIAHLLLPTQACIVLGAAAGAVLLYMAFFSENIYFELDDDGAFRYFKRGRQENGLSFRSAVWDTGGKANPAFSATMTSICRYWTEKGTKPPSTPRPWG